METILNVEDLNIWYKTQSGKKHVVKGVSFSLKESELLALVGGSGCGKTTICKFIVGLLGKEAVTEGNFFKSEKSGVAMIFQDPYLSLDPSQTIGKQIEEAILIHKHKHFLESELNPKIAAKEKALELLNLVGIDNPESRYHHIPLSFSGGMRQRIAIAIALAMKPDVIIADELTSSLDRENSIQIMNLLNSLRHELRTAIIMVTHDIGMVEDYSDKLIVMKDGEIIEEGNSKKIFEAPFQEYTKKLVRYAHYGHGTEHTHGDLHFHNGIPHSHEHDSDMDIMAKHDHKEVKAQINKDQRLGHIPHLLEVRKISKSYRSNRNETVEVFKNLSFNIHKGELLGLSGASGIGKTTLAKCILGLEKIDDGQIKLSKELESKSSKQMVFQDSKSSLNPRMNVNQLLNEAIKLGKNSVSAKQLIKLVELDSSLLTKRPYEISGGQRQRIAIARALAMKPRLLIADEPISSLDMEVQAQMIHLIKRIQQEENLTVLLISHDLPMLMHVSDRIIHL